MTFGSSNLEPIVTFKGEEAENLDSELTYSEFVTGKDKTKSEVYVNITNIHCSVCVWLNEKVLSETKGIHKVRINFSTGRAHIVWDDNLIKLSRIFQSFKALVISQNFTLLEKKRLIIIMRQIYSLELQ